ncbi:sugar transferase [Sphingomonas sp. IC4-52]|uniref:sugar transferase n=1 Tax=Sphingomonas sp. IC4-52 TaxID=2887202 RepID=UPI001D121FD2|nr:sugar transferase [Sphingomonas sp. IC4-52]MCC2981308.1 sugar transferase [Sphingomonas sp. IC4-52]
MKKIIVVASLAYSLVNFRGALLRKLIDEGYEVIACAPDRDEAVMATLLRWNIQFLTVPMDRTGKNPLSDLATLKAVTAIFQRERPDVVLAYTQKPIIYSGIAARLVGGIDFYPMVSGLGHVFSEGGTMARSALRQLVTILYREALRRARCVFVFNSDDAGELRRQKILFQQPVMQVPGSGVDTAHFTLQPLPQGNFKFVIIARLMRDKGLEEFVAAARALRTQWPGSVFQIVGPLDTNPTGIVRAEIATWENEGVVQYLGETRDVRPFLSEASVFVLPSYYREGLPRSILEAMATGRAVITTDMPGCRDAVVDGVTGFVIPPRHPAALIQAMLRFRSDPGLAARMGAEARARAERHYAVDLVNEMLVRAVAKHREGSDRGIDRRHVLDKIVAGVALILALPVMFAVGAVVLASLGRPVFFEQQRTGRDGKPFILRKFRTMREEYDTVGAPLSDAARLTSTGRFLRRTRLDELPQLFAILRGDMALVGPRPLLPETVASLGEAGRIRGRVRPGLTGWAQVNGNTLLSDAEKAALDGWYIANRSLRLDLSIVLRTIGTIFLGEHVRKDIIERAYAGATNRRG